MVSRKVIAGGVRAIHINLLTEGTEDWKTRYGDPFCVLNDLRKKDYDKTSPARIKCKIINVGDKSRSGVRYRNLVKNIIANPFFLLYAYENIKSNLEFPSPKKSQKKESNDLNLKWFVKTGEELREGTYRFGVSRRV